MRNKQGEAVLWQGTVRLVGLITVVVSIGSATSWSAPSKTEGLAQIQGKSEVLVEAEWGEGVEKFLRGRPVRREDLGGFDRDFVSPGIWMRLGDDGNIYLQQRGEGRRKIRKYNGKTGKFEGMIDQKHAVNDFAVDAAGNVIMWSLNVGNGPPGMIKVLNSKGKEIEKVYVKELHGRSASLVYLDGAIYGREVGHVNRVVKYAELKRAIQVASGLETVEERSRRRRGKFRRWFFGNWNLELGRDKGMNFPAAHRVVNVKVEGEVSLEKAPISELFGKLDTFLIGEDARGRIWLGLNWFKVEDFNPAQGRATFVIYNRDGMAIGRFDPPISRYAYGGHKFLRYWFAMDEKERLYQLDMTEDAVRVLRWSFQRITGGDRTP